MVIKKIKSIVLCLFFISLLFLSLGIIVLALCGSLQQLTVVLAGYFISFVILGSSFVSLMWAFRQPIQIFYKVLFLGMLLRVLLFLSTVFFVYEFTGLSVLLFVFTFMFFYIMFQIVEIYYAFNKAD